MSHVWLFWRVTECCCWMLFLRRRQAPTNRTVGIEIENNNSVKQIIVSKSNNFNPQNHASFVLDQSQRDYYMRLAAASAALGLFLWAIIIVDFHGAAYGFSFSMDGKTTKKHYQQQQQQQHQPFLPHYHSQTKEEQSIVAMTMTVPDDFQPTNNKKEDNKNDDGTSYIGLAKNNVCSKPLPEFDFYKPKAAASDDDVWETFGYGSNPTVFGQILRGELKTRILTETKQLLAFVDVKPRAPFHGLIIPKEHIRSVLELEKTEKARLANGDESHNNKRNVEEKSSLHFSSSSLVHEISDVAHRLLQNHCPEAYRTGDYILCFHIPPFTSVDHLHLHVLAPASSMGPLYRYGKYNCEATTNTNENNNNNNNNYNVRWCIGLTTVLERIQGGLPPTPYSRSDSWGTIAYDALASVKSILLDRIGFGR